MHAPASTEDMPPKRHGRLRAWMALALIAAVPLGSVIFALRDEPPPELADLTPAAIPPTPLAWEGYRKLAEDFAADLPTISTRAPRSSRLQVLGRTNAVPPGDAMTAYWVRLDEANAAAERAGDTPAAQLATPVAGGSSFRHFAVIASGDEWAEGRRLASWQHLVSLARAGRALEVEDNRPYPDYSATLQLVQLLRAESQAPGITDSQLRAAIEVVENLRPSERAFVEKLKRYHAQFESFDAYLHAHPERAAIYLHWPNRLGRLALVLYHPNETKRWVAENFRETIRLNDAPYARVLTGEFHRPKWQWFGKVPYPDNALGRAILASPSIEARRLLAQRLDLQSDISVTVAALALTGYEREHGRLPASLRELVPDYVPLVPRDYGRGVPLEYDAGTRSISFQPCAFPSAPVIRFSLPTPDDGTASSP